MDGQKSTSRTPGAFSSSSYFRNPDDRMNGVAHAVLGKWNSYESGFRIILLCFFVFTLSVTTALVVQILYGKPEVVYDGAVVSDERVCTDIGKSLLAKGGSAMDAVVAAAFCLSLKRPHSGGLGGGGFLLVHKHGHSAFSEALNFREISPRVELNGPEVAAARYEDSKRGLLVGVPGVVAGLEAAHARYGHLGWEDVLQPTIRLSEIEQLFPSESSKITGMRASLTKILEGGAREFYNGTIASSIVNAASQRGGVIAAEDLRAYSPVWQEPVRYSFGDELEVIAPDFPSAGPAILHSLGIISRKGVTVGKISDAGLRQLSMDSLTLSLRRFFWSGDPIFSGNLSDGGMMSMGTINADAAMISEDLSTPLLLRRVLPRFPSAFGVHAAAVDSSDLYVSYVSGLGVLDVDPITVPGAGFDLNSAMLDFDLSDPAGDAPGMDNAVDLINRLRPGRRPLSLAVPVMIVPKKRLCRARVITGSSHVGSVLQVLARKVFMGDPSRDAVEKSRLYLGEIFGVPGYLKEPNDLSPGRTLNGPYPSVNIIVKVNDSISAYADSRSKGG